MKKIDVCVFGGCSLDMTFFQKEDGSYNPLPDICEPGGKGSNQAVAASRAGAKVAMISRVGKDNIGQEIFKNLIENKITTDGVELVEGLKNDCNKIYVETKTKDNKIIRQNGAIDSFSTDMIARNKEILLNSKIIVAQLKAPKEVSISLINFCKENNLPLVITPCRPEKLKMSEKGNAELFDKITYITANRKECSIIFGTNDIVECVKKYPNKLIVTLGSDGVVYFDGESIKKFDAVQVENIVDTTGAGDTFNGNLVALLAKGHSLQVSVEKAQYASAMKLTKPGAQAGMPYKKELEEFIKTQS